MKLNDAENQCELIRSSGQGQGFFNSEPYKTTTLERAESFVKFLC